MKKILFSDYDNTLYRNSEEIKENIKYINEFISKGNIFGIASGRDYIDIKKEIEKYNIPFNYLVLNHGATILDNKLNKIKSYIIPNEVATAIYNKVKDNINLKEKIIYSIDKKDVSIDNDIVKILFVFDSIDETLRIKEYIDTNYKDNIKTYISEHETHTTLEIISNLTNKSNGINIVKDIENINKENIYVIGDNYNDVEMIQEFNGYAIKNAIDYVKTLTNKYYDSVSDLIKDII